MEKNKIVIFEAADGSVKLDVDTDNETVWFFWTKTVCCFWKVKS